MLVCSQIVQTQGDHTLNANNYVECCEVAGLYLGNESHFARYRDYAEKISAAGLNTVIVHDFLHDNDAGIDVPGCAKPHLLKVKSYQNRHQGFFGGTRFRSTNSCSLASAASIV